MGNAGLFVQVLRIVERMQRQQSGMAVAVFDNAEKDVMRDEDIKKWQSQQVTAPAEFSDVWYDRAGAADGKKRV